MSASTSPGLALPVTSRRIAFVAVVAVFDVAGSLFRPASSPPRTVSRSNANVAPARALARFASSVRSSTRGAAPRARTPRARPPRSGVPSRRRVDVCDRPTGRPYRRALFGTTRAAVPARSPHSRAPVDARVAARDAGVDRRARAIGARREPRRRGRDARANARDARRRGTTTDRGRSIRWRSTRAPTRGADAATRRVASGARALVAVIACGASRGRARGRRGDRPVLRVFARVPGERRRVSSRTARGDHRSRETRTLKIIDR